VKLTDVNLLLYAHDEASPNHARARVWFEERLSGSETFAFAWVCLLAFVRLTTNPRVYADPLRPSEALDHVECLARATLCDRPAPRREARDAPASAGRAVRDGREPHDRRASRGARDRARCRALLRRRRLLPLPGPAVHEPARGAVGGLRALALPLTSEVAAVDHQFGARRERRVVARQVGDRAGDLTRPGAPSEWCQRHDAAVRIVFGHR
jgi:predicted nucleic acid-binding protein